MNCHNLVSFFEQVRDDSAEMKAEVWILHSPPEEAWISKSTKCSAGGITLLVTTAKWWPTATAN